jgi:hypothetical protein
VLGFYRGCRIRRSELSFYQHNDGTPSGYHHNLCLRSQEYLGILFFLSFLGILLSLLIILLSRLRRATAPFAILNVDIKNQYGPSVRIKTPAHNLILPILSRVWLNISVLGDLTVFETNSQKAKNLRTSGYLIHGRHCKRNTDSSVTVKSYREEEEVTE